MESANPWDSKEWAWAFTRDEALKSMRTAIEHAVAVDEKNKNPKYPYTAYTLDCFIHTAINIVNEHTGGNEQ